MRVLIADDDPVSLLVVDAAVRRLGHESLVASDGLQAWRMVLAGGGAGA
jgi:CheY-like chemotaxis protein